MAPVIERYTIADGVATTAEFFSDLRVATGRDGRSVAGSPLMGWMPENPGDEITMTPDDNGRVLLDRKPVGKLVLGRDGDGSTLFDGVYVKEVEPLADGQ